MKNEDESTQHLRPDVSVMVNQVRTGRLEPVPGSPERRAAHQQPQGGVAPPLQLPGGQGPPLPLRTAPRRPEGAGVHGQHGAGDRLGAASSRAIKEEVSGRY